MATLLQVTEILTGAMPAYPNFKRPAGQEREFFCNTWLRYVGHLAPDVLQAAMDKAVINHPDFYPSPGHVLEAAGQIEAGKGRTGLEAWHDMAVAVAKHGYNDPPGVNWVFDDPITTEAAIALGWRAYCASDEDSLRWAFAKIYDALRARAVDRLKELPAPQVRKELAP